MYRLIKQVREINKLNIYKVSVQTSVQSYLKVERKMVLDILGGLALSAVFRDLRCLSWGRHSVLQGAQLSELRVVLQSLCPISDSCMRLAGDAPIWRDLAEGRIRVS